MIDGNIRRALERGGNYEEVVSLRRDPVKARRVAEREQAKVREEEKLCFLPSKRQMPTTRLALSA